MDDALPHPMTDDTDAIRNLLASFVHRFGITIANAPAGFEDFAAGHGVRTPVEIVEHLDDLMRLSLHVYESPDRLPAPPEADDATRWSDAVTRVRRRAGRLDRHLASRSTPHPDRLLDLDQALRGPIADAVTHVGQLATLRRLAGAPIESQRYWKVAMDPAGAHAPST